MEIGLKNKEIENLLLNGFIFEFKPKQFKLFGENSEIILIEDEKL